MKTYDIDYIIENVCKYHNMPTWKIYLKTHEREIVEPRQIAMYFTKRKTNMSLYAIGDEFNKNHATVLHACKKVQNIIDTDKKFKEKINSIEIMINRGYNMVDQLLNKIKEIQKEGIIRRAAAAEYEKNYVILI